MPGVAAIATSFVSVVLLLAEQLPLVTVHFNTAGVPATTPVMVVVFDAGVVIEAVPLTRLHKPVPVAGLPAELGLLAAMVNEPLLHWAEYEPGEAVTGRSFVRVVLLLAEQLPLVTVHFNTAGVPATTPVTVVVFEDGVVIVAVPLTKVHKPVPGEGSLAAIVNAPLLHCAPYVPGVAAIDALLVSVVLLLAEQLPLVTVHFNTAGVPATTPVTVVVFDVGVVIVAVPLTNVHSPVPVAGLPPEFGLLAAIVNVPLVHWAE